MKIGILTFHNAHNYGAVLQAYALKKVLQKMGNEVDIVNYENKVLREKYARNLKVNFKLSDIRHPRGLKYKLKFNKKISIYKEAWERQHGKFRNFIDTYLLDGHSETYDMEQLEKLEYDAFIVGSDQVWTSMLTGGLDDVYLLNFKTKAKKISYAASIYGGQIPEKECSIFKKCLKDFDAISVREETLQRSLKEQCGCSAVTVLDPTLLLDAKEYEEICQPLSAYCKEEYVFAYFVAEKSELYEIAATLSKKNGCKLIELHYYDDQPGNKNYLADVGPEEFLMYIKNAKYVITNSFHGTVFSILYHKQFYSVYQSDTRMDGLLKYLNLQKCHITNLCPENLMDNIDYRDVDERLKELRRESLEYLRRVLKSQG